MKMQYRIHYRKDDNKTYSHDLESSSEDQARQSFRQLSKLPIVNVENISFQGIANQVAGGLISMAKESKDPKVKAVGEFAKPIAALATVVATQYANILKGEEFDSVSDMTSRIWKLMLGEKVNIKF